MPNKLDNSFALSKICHYNFYIKYINTNFVSLNLDDQINWVIFFYHQKFFILYFLLLIYELCKNRLDQFLLLKTCYSIFLLTCI